MNQNCVHYIYIVTLNLMYVKLNPEEPDHDLDWGLVLAPSGYNYSKSITIRALGLVTISITRY